MQDTSKTTNIEKNYDPHALEEKWTAFWLKNRTFHSEPSDGGKSYCVVIPPPNVTGILHMGHALNNTIQDILVRRSRMQGRNTVWIPGTDHAGIATQNVVERALAKEGKKRDDLGREAFVKRVWEWKQQYGSTIISQLKRLGSSCDWERERFTMDEGLSNAVTEVFCRLFEKGLIYKGNYLVNWCPRCQTALSDEESEHKETNGKLYYIRYPVKGGRPRPYVTVATTRPETMLGDTAVAVNPADERYKDLVGGILILPVIGREMRVIGDDFVDPAFGTGAVKVTPAHDPNDFQMGRRHNLESVDVMTDSGLMNEKAGPYAGMDRFDCRKALVAELQRLGLMEKIDEHKHSVGHCYRCHTMVEPRLSPQWFVKMKPLALKAIEVVKNDKVTFVPERWTKVYLEWMENIRDWCISRQIWWGHRIPVFYCDACSKQWADRGKPTACPDCGSDKVRQDEDVLDTWFSSWLWPFSTLGWPEKSRDLGFYYPTNDLVTASEIIFFWVARMIMGGLEFMGDIPFSQVYIHGTVRDDTGRKMSKSLGNSIDPVEIIDKYSADALRFTLMMVAATGQDVYLSNDKFEIGRNFATKIWNASRFMLMQTDGKWTGGTPASPLLAGETPSPDDQHILHKLNETIVRCNESLDKRRFNDAATSVYEFVWHHYCDWYVEYSKTILYGQDQARKDRVLRIMHYCYSNALRLLSPFMPFITEELWHSMGYGSETESISRAKWPEDVKAEDLSEMGIKPAVVSYVAEKYDLIKVGRTLRSDYTLPPSAKIDYVIKPANADDAEKLNGDLESVATFLRAGKLTVDAAYVPGKATPSGVAGLGTVYMPVQGLIDIAAEVQRLGKQREKLDGELRKIAGKLGNEAFIGKAPPEVVANERQRQKDLTEKSDKLSRLIESLSG